MKEETEGMEDFNWTIPIGGKDYTLTMNICKDDSPWVGEVTCDGEPSTCEAVRDAVENTWHMTEEKAEKWLDDALERRLQWQKENR